MTPSDDASVGMTSVRVSGLVPSGSSIVMRYSTSSPTTRLASAGSASDLSMVGGGVVNSASSVSCAPERPSFGSSEGLLS